MTRPGCKNWRRTRKIGAVLSALVIAALLLPCAYADIKVEGWREQRYDYTITNISDYPDYVFLTSSAIRGWEFASVLDKTGSFGGGYKLDGFYVHAIRSSDFNAARFFSQRDEYDRDVANCADYCQNNPNIASSSLFLPKAVSVQEAISLEKIKVFLKVDGIADQVLNISKVKMLYYYTNGTAKETNAEEL